MPSVFVQLVINAAKSKVQKLIKGPAESSGVFREANWNAQLTAEECPGRSEQGEFGG